MGMSEREKDPAMKEGYLWDGSGEPDPEVQKLESLLRRYRHDQPAPAFDPLAQEQPRPRGWRFPAFRFSFPLAAAAAVVLRSEEHTSELQSRLHLVCRLLLEKKKT